MTTLSPLQGFRNLIKKPLKIMEEALAMPRRVILLMTLNEKTRRLGASDLTASNFRGGLA